MSIWQLLIITVVSGVLVWLTFKWLRFIMRLFSARKRPMVENANRASSVFTATAPTSESVGEDGDQIIEMFTPVKVLVGCVALAFAFDLFAVLGLYATGYVFAFPTFAIALIFLLPAIAIVKYADTDSIFRKWYSRAIALLILFFIRGVFLLMLGFLADATSEQMEETMKPGLSLMLCMIIFWRATAAPRATSCGFSEDGMVCSFCWLYWRFGFYGRCSGASRQSWLLTAMVKSLVT